MTLMSFIILLIIAGVCGSIGRSIAGYSHGGCLVSIALGFIGAYLGVWIAETFRLPVMITIEVGHQNFPILWSIIGSTIFVAIISFFTRRR
ncbi:MAG TPA: hypothetical protein VEZ90_13650 [Blastocatellia bacterium]|nr:hypothetical protein [Blastocatellia bacterium]